MAIIQVPKPPKNAIDKGRRVSGLLQNQLRHLQEAEFRLPAKMQTNIYINAIKTEGEAADYIGKVTKALRAAHGSYEARGLEIAAAAAPRKKRKGAKKAKPDKKKKRKK